MEHELAPDLQKRLKDALGSYEELQLLLYARAQPGAWSAEDAIRKLHLEEPPLNEALECLVFLLRLLAFGLILAGNRLRPKPRSRLVLVLPTGAAQGRTRE